MYVYVTKSRTALLEISYSISQLYTYLNDLISSIYEILMIVSLVTYYKI